MQAGRQSPEFSGEPPARSRHGRCNFRPRRGSRRGPSNTARNGLGRRDGAVRPSRRDPHDGGSGPSSCGGAAQAADQQREQRPGSTRQDLCCVRDTSKPGRYHSADEAEPDQTDCDSHPSILPATTPQLKCQGVVRKLFTSMYPKCRRLTLRAGTRPGRSSNLYQANLTGRVDPATGGPRRAYRRIPI